MGSIIFHAVFFALLSSIFIVAGLRVLLAKSPFIVSQRWQAIMMIIGFIPSMVSSTEALWPKYPGESWLIAFLPIGMFMAPWIMMLWFLRGYLVFGVSGRVLRDVLRHALGRLGLPYEESARTYHLLTMNNELLVDATPIDSDGIFLLRLKKSGNRPTFRRLAAEIDDFFRTTPVPTKRRGSYALVVLGGVILLVGSCLTYYRLSLHAKSQALRKAHPEYFKSSEK